MAEDLPYLISTKRFPDLLTALQTAAIPARLTTEGLKKFGFSSSNERAYPALLKKLGFLSASGEPTARYKAFRDKPSSGRVLAQGVREAYAELFQMNTEAHKATKDQIKGLIGRISDKEQRYVDLIATTFKMLCDAADFSPQPEAESDATPDPQTPASAAPSSNSQVHVPSLDPEHVHHRSLSFRYNIEIHLPATTDIAVYNAIFRAIKEHLGS